MRFSLSIMATIALLSLTCPAQAATLSKLPDILSNAHQEVTTDSLNQSLLNLMHQRDSASSASALDKLAPAAGPEAEDHTLASPSSDIHAVYPNSELDMSTYVPSPAAN